MHFFDSEFLKDVVSNSDTHHQQVTAGKFEGKIKRIILPDIIIKNYLRNYLPKPYIETNILTY